jgi:hypothetical protein
MSLLLFSYEHGVVDLHFFGHNFYGLVHFACSLCVHRKSKVNLCHLVLWQPITCECFPNNLSEFLNLKFTSKVALINVNIISLQIQILMC